MRGAIGNLMREFWGGRPAAKKDLHREAFNIVNPAQLSDEEKQIDLEDPYAK